MVTIIGKVQINPSECKKMKFELCHVDTCFPDYWSGHHLPHIQIYPYPGMTLDNIKNQLLSELNCEAVAGSWDYEALQSEEFYEAARLAISELMSNDPDQTTFFNDLDIQDDDGCDSVCAYFVFVPVEE